MYKLLILSALVAVAFAASYDQHDSHGYAYSSQNHVHVVKDSVPVEIKVKSAPVVHHVPVVSHVPVVHHVPVNEGFVIAIECRLQLGPGFSTQRSLSLEILDTGFLRRPPPSEGARRFVYISKGVHKWAHSTINMYKLVILSALVAVACAASYGHHESHEHAYSTQNQVNYVKHSVPVEIKVKSAPVVHHVPVVSHVPVVHHVPVIHHVQAPVYHH
ncbi:unnamed protein product [Nezara viridula]|uniref:Neuropeptide n=1 Tax=Nezara viridula TaxID=85310 RepID=A0A9P0HS60_NEZVI|nr:unnamed protein product [Nezara viridula]